MQSHFRNFAIWVVIGLLLFALFNLFQNPTQTSKGNTIGYSEFIAQIDQGNITDVVIQGQKVSGNFADKSRAFCPWMTTSVILP